MGGYDIISGGRFAMNVVGGWNRREFDMFGIELLGHEERYVYLTEWLDIIRRLWSADAEINVQSRWFKEGAWSQQIERYKRLAREEFGKTIQVWTNAPVVLRDADEEAEDRRRYHSKTMADRVAIESFIGTLARENKVPEDSEQMRFMRRTVVLGTGTPLVGSGTPLVGSAETIARTLISLSRAGLDGVIMIYVDFVDGLHRFQRDVLPRLRAAYSLLAEPIPNARYFHFRVIELMTDPNVVTPSLTKTLGTSGLI